MTDTPLDFIAERAPWLAVGVVPTALAPAGTGWSVALCLDATYETRQDADQVAAIVREQLAAALDEAGLTPVLVRWSTGWPNLEPRRGRWACPQCGGRVGRRWKFCTCGARLDGTDE
jgi:hypothetical protein